MKYGAHSYLWTAQWSDKSLDLIVRAKNLGLDFLEISNGDDVVFDAAKTKQLALDSGIELLLSPGGEWPMNCDISSTDCQNRRRGLSWHQRSLDLAAEMGAIAYVGAIYGHPGHVMRQIPTMDDYRRIAESLNILAHYAEQRRIRLVLEPMSHFRTHLVNTPEQMMQLIGCANHPQLMILLDTYHLMPAVRNYEAAILTTGSRLWGLHACENDRGVPGSGLMPWSSISAALRKIRFDGYVGLESYNSGTGGFAVTRGLFHNPCPDGDRFVQEGLPFLKSLLRR